MKKVKKVLSLILCSLLLIGLVPVAARADDVTDSTVDEAAEFTTKGGGTGTKEDPYLISSADDLIKLAAFVNKGDAAGYDKDCQNVGNFHGYYFKQTTDIDLSGSQWEPIGYSGGEELYFAGNYDGDNHAIINATSTVKNDDEGYATAGIFGWVLFGSVSNLHVKNADFSATGQNNYAYVGGLSGVAYGADITNCSASNSKLDAKGVPSDNFAANNVTAGGIVGYSAGSNFSQCASESNIITTTFYGGGLVGELDDDQYDPALGTSSFTNCYVVNGSVKASTPNKQDSNFSGGFIGQVTSSKLTAKNCYVFSESITVDKNTSTITDKGTGVFAANLWHDGFATMELTNCYYGKCGSDVTENIGTATSLEKTEFENGNVTKDLGESFVQGKNYPILGDSPADYSVVDDAIASANKYETDKNLYTNYNDVENAIKAVDRTKTAKDQAIVNSMATAIKKAVDALQYKDADYNNVDAALKKVKALNKADYENFDAVEKAVNAVVQGKNITEQANVDAMAKAIEDAIASLQLKGADYKKVDDALEKVKALNKADYENFDAVEKAVNAVDRKKNITDQATVDKYAEDIENAISSLKRKPDPSKEPTGEPPKTPSETLTGTPTPNPTRTPTTAPTSTPTTSPAKQPTAEPSKAPTTEPTKAPTTAPQSKPTAEPSVKPSTDTNKSAEKKETPLYRLYNPHSGEHFYTKEPGEKDALVKIGWKYEGQAWSSPETGIPVYRLYNPNAGDHFYTTSVGERKYLVKLGWKYEGIGWYAVRKGRAVYRLYNPNAKGAGSHHYTTSIGERAILIKLGWRAEGIAWDAI